MRWSRSIVMMSVAGLSVGLLGLAPAGASPDHPSVRPEKQPGDFYAVSAVSSSDVWAVGTRAGTAKTAVAHWDGAAWTSYRAPSPCEHLNELRAVDALAANDVWAVGACASARKYRTLIEHWDGARWTRVASPNVGRENSLAAVTAVSTDDVWALGFSPSRSEYFGLHWDGSAWSLVDVPHGMVDMSALSATDAWGVGYDTLFHYDGSTWSSSSTIGGRVGAVDARSADDVWAVGETPVSGAKYSQFAEHWDGSGWEPVSLPDGPGYRSTLTDVSVATESSVWAVGSFDAAHRRYYVTSWDGSSWVVRQRSQQGWIKDVAAVAPDDVWVVGGMDVGGGLINAEHWDGHHWTGYAVS